MYKRSPTPKCVRVISKNIFNCTESVLTTMYHWQFGERKHLNERLSICISTSILDQCVRRIDLDLEWNKIKMHLCNFNPKCYCNKTYSYWEHSRILGHVLQWMSIWLKMQQILFPSIYWLEYCSIMLRNVVSLRGDPQYSRGQKLRLSIQPEKELQKSLRKWFSGVWLFSTSLIIISPRRLDFVLQNYCRFRKTLSTHSNIHIHNLKEQSRCYSNKISSVHLNSSMYVFVL